METSFFLAAGYGGKMSKSKALRKKHVSTEPTQDKMDFESTGEAPLESFCFPGIIVQSTGGGGDAVKAHEKLQSSTTLLFPGLLGMEEEMTNSSSHTHTHTKEDAACLPVKSDLMLAVKNVSMEFSV